MRGEQKVGELGGAAGHLADLLNGEDHRTSHLIPSDWLRCAYRAPGAALVLVESVACSNASYPRLIQGGDVSESLQDLIRRIMREQDIDCVRSLYRRLPDAHDRVTYETVRKLANGEQRGTRDTRVFRDLAIMLRVDENDVRAAMGVPPTYGEWQLPPRAQSLNLDERAAVMGVVDAILRAKRVNAASSGAPVAHLRDDQSATAETDVEHELPPGYRRHAARGGRKSGLIPEQEQAGEENQDGPDQPA